MVGIFQAVCSATWMLLDRVVDYCERFSCWNTVHGLMWVTNTNAVACNNIAGPRLEEDVTGISQREAGNRKYPRRT